MKLIGTTCLLILYCGLSTLTAAQQEYLYETEHHLRISVDMFGKITSSPYSTMNILIFPTQEIIRRDSIREELELVDSQGEQLDKFFENLDEKRREYVKEIGQKPLTTSQKEDLKAYRESAKNQIEEILLPFQEERLAEIEQYIQFQKLGLQQTVVELAKTQSKASTINKRAIGSKIEHQKKQTENESKALATEFIEELFSSLPEKKKQAIERVIGAETMQTLNLDLLLLDLNNSECQEHESPAKMSTVELLKGMAEFTAGPDGVWRRSNKKEFPDDIIFMELAYCLRASPDEVPELRLSESQIASLQLFLDSYDQRKQDATKEYAETFRNTPQSRMRETQLEYQKKKSELRRELKADFLAIIPETQLQRLNDRLLRAHVFSNGLVSELVSNKWIQEQAEISEGQIEAIRKKIPDVREKVLEQLETLGISATKSILEDTPDELRDRVIDVMQYRPKEMPPTLSFLR